MTGQLLLFPAPELAEQLALDIDPAPSRATPGESPSKVRTTTKGPTMPTPDEQFDYLIWPLRKLAEAGARRRARRAARTRRDHPLTAGLGNLTPLDVATIRYALEDRARMHQGTPAGEAATITRSKLG